MNEQIPTVEMVNEMNWVQSALGVEQDESVTLTLETDEDVI